MSSYILRRLLALFPVLLGVSVVIFVVIHLTPGDPAIIMAGPEATGEVLDQIRKDYGLDQPLPVQYVVWLSHVLRGDLGESIFLRRPVVNEILDKLQNTAILAGASLLMSTTLGILFGIISATKQYSLLDRVVTLVSLFGVSMPVFWLGMVFIIVFAGTLHLFPAQGMIAPTGGGPVDVLKHLVLPAVALALPSMTIVTRLTRSAMLEVIRQDYVRTAFAKGLATRTVLYRHALKNAMIPVITVVGTQVGYLLGGAVLVEFVFSWPGLGTLVVTGIGTRDYPVVQGATLVIGAIFVLVNLVVDVIYAYIDPRIHYA